MRSFMRISLVLSVLMLIPFTTFAAFTDGLVLYFPLDEGSGNVAGDRSDHGHDGAINEAVWVAGQFGQALQFTGEQPRDSGSGTFITVESTDAMNVNEMTFMAWINAEHWDGTRQIVGKSVHGGCTGRTQYGLFSEGGVFRLRFETEAGRADVDAPDLLATGEWVHIAFTNDGTNAAIYINGGEVASGAVPGPLNANDDPWRIGQDCGREDYIFAGTIDDVRLWNRALSADEINEFKDQGAEILTGETAVEPQDKLSTTWASIKSEY